MCYIIHQYLPYSCRDEGDMGLIPGSGRSSGEGNGDHYSIPAWRILWTEEPGKLYSPQRHKESNRTEQMNMQAQIKTEKFFLKINLKIFKK